MMLCLFIALSLSRNLNYKSSAPDGSQCESTEGCNIQALNSTLSHGDQITFLDSMIQGDAAREILTLINESSRNNLSIIGQPTEISNPTYQPTEYPAIYVEESALSLKSISFKYFKIPIINAIESEISLDSVSLEESSFNTASPFAFINSKLIANRFKLQSVSCVGQTMIAGLNVDVSITEFEFIQNNLISENPIASMHFVQSEISIVEGVFRYNSMKLPLFALTNETSLDLQRTFFDQNSLLTVISAEESTKINFNSCTFTSNTGRIVDGGSFLSVNFIQSSISKHSSQDVLFLLSDSNLIFDSCQILNSSIVGLALNIFPTGGISISASSMIIENLETSLPIFTSIGGQVTINGLKVKGITSESEILVLNHIDGKGTSLTDSKFTKMSAKNKISTSITVTNSSTVTFERVKWTKNDACGALFDNTRVAIHNSIFENNQCSPTGNTMPLAIISASKTDSVMVSSSHFTNNTALTGAVFILNSTATIANSEFEGNKAVQGAAIFAAAMNIRVLDSNFRDNSAMTVGGAISLSDGDSEILSCKFIANQAPEGSALSIKMGKNTIVRKCEAKGNMGNNATFIHATGEIFYLEDLRIDDDQDVAEFIRGSIKYSSVLYGCKRKCQNPKSSGVNFPWLWVILPLAFAIVVFAYRKFASNGLPRAFRSKGRHNL